MDNGNIWGNEIMIRIVNTSMKANIFASSPGCGWGWLRYEFWH